MQRAGKSDVFQKTLPLIACFKSNILVSRTSALHVTQNTPSTNSTVSRHYALLSICCQQHSGHFLVHVGSSFCRGCEVLYHQEGAWAYRSLNRRLERVVRYGRNGLCCRSAGANGYMRTIDRWWLAGSALSEGYKSSVKTYEFHDRNERINFAYCNWICWESLRSQYSHTIIFSFAQVNEPTYWLTTARHEQLHTIQLHTAQFIGLREQQLQ